MNCEGCLADHGARLAAMKARADEVEAHLAEARRMFNHDLGTMLYDNTNLRGRVRVLEDYILTKGIPDAPCPICHYNGNGYYSGLMHDCVKRHKALEAKP